MPSPVRFASIDIPKAFNDRFNDGEMLDDPDIIEKVLIDFISDYCNSKKDEETIGCEEQHGKDCYRCHRCTYVRCIDEFPPGNSYCYSCIHEMNHSIDS